MISFFNCRVKSGAAVVLGILSLTSVASIARADDFKVGVVDMQKALQTVDAGKKARASLEKEFNDKKAQLQKEKAAIDKMGEEFKKQSLAMSEEARAKKQGELQERFMKFQETTARSQAEIQQKEAELTQPIIVKLRGIIAELAKQKKLSLVLERNENLVLFSQEKDDLTQEAIAAFNKAK